MPEDQVLLNHHSQALVEDIRPGEILVETQVFGRNGIQGAMRVEKGGNVDAADHLAAERGVVGKVPQNGEGGAPCYSELNGF